MDNTADFRRGNRQPSYQRLPRREYEQRAYEFNPRGEQFKRSKLTDLIVMAIRSNVKGETDKQQADKYGVTEQAIYKARKGITWRHLE